MKTELLVVAGLLAAGYGSVDTQQFKVSIIDYQCSHYKNLERVDEYYEFNKPEIYNEIQDTCKKLRKSVS